MADERQQQTLMVSQDEQIPELSQIESLQNDCDKRFKIVPSTDILQQALDEASGITQSSDFEKTENSLLIETTQHLSDHSYIHPSNSISSIRLYETNSSNVDRTDNNVYLEDDDGKNLHLSQLSVNVSNINSTEILETSTLHNANKTDVNGEVLSFSTNCDNSCIDVLTDTSTVSNPEKSESVLCVKTSATEPYKPELAIQTKEPTTLKTDIASPSSNLNIASIKLPAKKIGAPLGSVENPIQIIQNGNSYHSTQMLTQAQLQQIALVLQKQQAQKVLQNKSKSILYDAATNTRIVCRIVHPSELQQKVTVQPNSQEQANVAQAKGTSSPFRGRGRQKRLHNRKMEDDDKANPELSKEEREAKKKHRPRTRSGRISKPPSYMVKDYKRIHHLDFNEEPYDDSDGGYSDFQLSDEESEKRSNKTNSLPPGVTTAKQRNYSCNSCSKAYIGRGGLSRHYRLNPTHGRMPEGEDGSTQDENSNSSLASSILSNSGSNTNSQTPTFSGVVPQIPVHAEITKNEAEIAPPPQYSSVTSNIITANKRKARLKEILKSFPDEDIHDAVFPKFAQDTSLWDFFVTKCNQKSEGLIIFEMLKEFEQFIGHMQRESHNCLNSANLEESHGKTIINISSKQIAAALSLETGSYEVKTATVITTEPEPHISAFYASEMVGITEDAPSLKRKRIDSPVEDVTTGLPDQILSDVIQGESLQLPLIENVSTHAELQTQDLHSLNTQLTVDNQHDVVSKGLFDLSSSTVVTPSSLSSGCLSAVNTSKMHSAAFLTVQSPPKVQVKKVHLFSAQQQQSMLPSNDISSPLSNLPVSTECTLNNLSPTHQEPIIIPKPAEMCNNNIAGGIPLNSNVDIFNSSVPELPAPSILDTNAESAHVVSSVALMNSADVHDQIVPSYAAPAVSVQTQIVQSIDKCLSESPVSSLHNSTEHLSAGHQALVPSEVNMSTSSAESNEFQATHNVIPEVAKVPETSAVLRQFILPDGQVISVWSQLENSDKILNEQFVQSYVPGNLIILQNPDGSIQVPNNQAVPAETLQTLATLNPALPNEAGTRAFSAVQPM